MKKNKELEKASFCRSYFSCHNNNNSRKNTKGLCLRVSSSTGYMMNHDLSRQVRDLPAHPAHEYCRIISVNGYVYSHKEGKRSCYGLPCAPRSRLRTWQQVLFDCVPTVIMAANMIRTFVIHVMCR